MFRFHLFSHSNTIISYILEREAPSNSKLHNNYWSPIFLIDYFLPLAAFYHFFFWHKYNGSINTYVPGLAKLSEVVSIWLVRQKKKIHIYWSSCSKLIKVACWLYNGQIVRNSIKVNDRLCNGQLSLTA